MHVIKVNKGREKKNCWWWFFFQSLIKLMHRLRISTRIVDSQVKTNGTKQLTS